MPQAARLQIVAIDPKKQSVDDKQIARLILVSTAADAINQKMRLFALLSDQDDQVLVRYAFADTVPIAWSAFELVRKIAAEQWMTKEEVLGVFRRKNILRYSSESIGQFWENSVTAEPADWPVHVSRIKRMRNKSLSHWDWPRIKAFTENMMASGESLRIAETSTTTMATTHYPVAQLYQLWIATGEDDGKVWADQGTYLEEIRGVIDTTKIIQATMLACYQVFIEKTEQLGVVFDRSELGLEP